MKIGFGVPRETRKIDQPVMPLRLGSRDSVSGGAGSESSPSSRDNTTSDRASERPPERQPSSSRSHSRSPHRHRHGHRRRRFRFKHKERNFLAAVCSMVVIVVLCTAMAEPNWFNVRGGGCRDMDKKSIHSMGVYQFFYLGHFEMIDGHSNEKDVASNEKNTQMVYQFSPNAGDSKYYC